MVLRGQYLERPVLVASGDQVLEGLSHRGDRPPAALILPPHPRQGGSMDSPVVAELAWALTRAGHPTLRINYRGVGASPGAWEEGAHDVEDVRAAVAHLRGSVPWSSDLPVALVGYAYGAHLILRALAAGVEAAAAVLIAPPVRRLDPSGLLQRLPPGPPVHTLAGDADTVAPPGEVAAHFSTIGARHRPQVVAGADHTFRQGLGELGRAVASLLAVAPAEGSGSAYG